MDIPSVHTIRKRASWTMNPDFDLRGCYRQLVASQHALLGAFQQLRERLATDGNGIQTDLLQVEAEIHQVDSAIKAFLPPHYFNELRSRHGTLEPHKALNTTEIIENILLQLSIRDLHTARQVNRKFRAIIHQSQSLQQAIFLRPNPKAKKFTPVLSDSDNIASKTTSTGRPRLKISGTKSSDPFTDPFNIFPNSSTSVNIQLTCEAGLENFRISPLYRKMQLCQPPIKELTVKSVSCCGSSRRDHHNLRSYFDNLAALKDLKRKKGITIGALYDFAKKVVEQHRLCPSAPLDLLDDKGEVHPEIKFSGVVAVKCPKKTSSLDMGDADPFAGLAGIPMPPIWPPVTQSTSSETPERTEKLEAHLQAYSVAKMLAAHNEVPIPTMKEYDGERVYYECLPKPYWLDNDFLSWNFRDN